MPGRKRKTNKKSRNPTHSVFTRYMLVVAVFIFWIAAIGVRLVHLQVNQHEWLRGQALEQRTYERESKMLRGTIYDRTERALAMSIKVKSLYADPMQIEDVEETAEQISKILKIDKKELIKDLRTGRENERQFVWIARKLDEEDYEKINEKLVRSDIKKYDLPKFPGLHWQEEQKRSYPYKNLAAHIIGFTNSEHLGLAGIELSQEDVLKGEIVTSVRERDRLGRVYEETEIEREPPKDVVLTISNSIQFKTEEALARGTKSARAKGGKAVVLDPQTGEILAMANYPSFDPNEYRKLDPKSFINHAIQDNYSPGSVFKLITYGAALEENLIDPGSTIDCGDGQITVGGHKFRDSHAVGPVSYTKALAQSSNVGAIKTGMLVGKDRFYKYAREFGFGEKTGIRLPAETGGILRSPERWNGDSLASMSIGYEIGVTALQSALAFATIANDGVKVQPHIIKEIRKSDGKPVTTIAPEKKRVVSPETARELRQMLRQVVLDGTARAAQLNGYTSAGKTGTAWKYDAAIKAVNRNKYVSSFVGFAPADKPRVVIAVIIDEPQGAARNGGQVAAPVFREIAEQILPELNVTPDGTLPEKPAATDEPEADNENPDLVETVLAENEDADARSEPEAREKTAAGKKNSKPDGKKKKEDRDKDGKKNKTAAAVNRKNLWGKNPRSERTGNIET
jgi:cell division protein FtsI (penicillin-binding protein 3)